MSGKKYTSPPRRGRKYEKEIGMKNETRKQRADGGERGGEEGEGKGGRERGETKKRNEQMVRR
jgi:hypothetical protein